MGSKETGRRRLFGACICGVLAGATAAPLFAADAPASETPEQMSNEITALKARLEQLEQRQQAIVNQKQVDDTKAAMAADAPKRSFGVSNGGFTSGYKDRRFTIQSEDGNFVFRPWLHLQLRNSTAYRQGGSTLDKDDVQNGFELRRARIGFDGVMFTPDLQYSFDWASYRGNSNQNITDSAGNTASFQHFNGGTPVLEEAWVLYHFHDTPWAVRAGQMHDPLDHENIVGSKYRTPEVSLQGDIFGNTDTFTQGVTLIYDTKKEFRFEGGFTDGIRSANTNFQDYPNNGIQYDWGVAGRVEYKLFGNWKEYNQLTAHGNKQDLLVIGAGVDNSQRGDTNSLSHTIDVQYANTNGMFLYASYFGRYTTNNPGIFNGAPVSTSVGGGYAHAGADTYEGSVLVQAAYNFDQKWEPFVRYEYMDLAGTPAGSHNNVQEISAGVNYYFYDHNLKFTTQLMYLPNGIPVNDDSNDVLINNGKQEYTLIAQLQLLL